MEKPKSFFLDGSSGFIAVRWSVVVTIEYLDVFVCMRGWPKDILFVKLKQEFVHSDEM